MSAKLEGPARALFADKNFAHLSIAQPDGTIYTVVIWAHVDDDGKILVNSAEGRKWPELLRSAKRATISAHNRENPYESVAVQVRLAGESHDDADEHIDSLAKKYMDVDTYPLRQPGERRVKFVLEPERVYYRG
jgi:hypothetical protein